MARRSRLSSRSEISGKVEKHREDMNEKGEEIEKDVSDIETVRETLDSLEGGTEDGAEAVGQSIEAAEGIGVGEFDQDSDELQQVHDETQEHEGKIHEGSDTVSSDLGKISDASGRIHGDAVNNELINAKEEAIRDKEFLDDEEKETQGDQKESQRLHDEHQARANSGRRS